LYHDFFNGIPDMANSEHMPGQGHFYLDSPSHGLHTNIHFISLQKLSGYNSQPGRQLVQDTVIQPAESVQDTLQASNPRIPFAGKAARKEFLDTHHGG
jgi:hypothetical protein